MSTRIAVTQSSYVDIFSAYNGSSHNFFESIGCISATGPGYRFCRNCIAKSDRFLPLPQKAGLIIENSICCDNYITELFCFGIKCNVQGQYLTGFDLNTGYSLFLIGNVAVDKSICSFVYASDCIFAVYIG